ncbi:MAG: trigger factor [Thermoleophilia bacterium]|nr:trigger factor [Thermoleophilia bacterium]
MKTEVSPAAENEVVLSIEVPQEAVAQMYERTLKRLAGEVQIPGFRKGKVPRAMVLSRLGEEYVRGETLNDALPEWYDTALKEAEVDAVSMPDLDLGDFDETAAFSFKATVQVRPTPVLGEYKGLEVPKREIEVTDGQVEAQLAMLQERFASLQPVEDRPVEHGDFVLMDLAGSSAGEPIEGAQANDYMAEIGRGNLIPGFEEALRGVGHGEQKSFDLTFPEDYHAEELRGTPVTFDVTVKEIKKKVVPELDDQFATEASEFATIGELRADVRARLETAAASSAEQEFRARALDAAVERATVTVPPAMIERQAHDLFHDLEQEVGERGLTMESYLALLQKTQKEVEEEMQPRAEHVIKRRLVLEAVIEAEGLEVSDDEIRERIKTDAELLGRDPNQLVLDVYKSGRHEQLREELLIAKAVDVIAESAVPVPLEDDESAAGGAAADVPAAETAAAEGEAPEAEAAQDEAPAAAKETAGDEPAVTTEKAGAPEGE